METDVKIFKLLSTNIYIWERIRLVIFLLDIIESRWMNSNKMNVSDTELLEAYFDLLTDEEITKLYQIYRLDFLQFDYSFTFRGRQYPQ